MFLRTAIRSIISNVYKPSLLLSNCTFLFLFTSTTPKSKTQFFRTLKCHAASKENSLLFDENERLPDLGSVSGRVRTDHSSMIAAIVTSIGGPPSAVGIVRLSGSDSVDIVARVFIPSRRRKKKKKKWTNDGQLSSTLLQSELLTVMLVGLMLQTT